MSQQPIPDYAHKVIVPVANPANAQALLELGLALAHPEDGHVLALVVSIGDAEDEAEVIAEIEPTIDAIDVPKERLRLITHVSTSVVRGILDAAREEGADLLILGVGRHARGDYALGTVVENVAATAPCDVLIYRAANKSEIKRIVVPADGSWQSKIACRVTTLLAKAYDVEAEAIYVNPGPQSYWESRARIEQSLHDIPGSHRIKRTVVDAQSPGAGILSRLDEEDILIVGVSERSTWERWLFGDLAQQFLNRAPCPVIFTARWEQQNGLVGAVRRGLNRFNLTLTQVEQDEMVWQAYNMAAPSLDFFVLAIIAATLASLGLLLNSATIIIGAMLVAPLMQPLIGLAIGLSTGRVRLARYGVVTLLLGILTALGVACFIGWLTTAQPPTNEMLARGNPSLLDAIVALASGIIGAYAMARKDIPAALAGVAIAAALMPPLCTVGLELVLGDRGLSLRAGSLFLTNIVCITVAAWGVFLAMGMRPNFAHTSIHQRWILLVVTVVIALPLLLVVINFSNQTNSRVLIEEHLREAVAPAELVSMDIVSDNPPRVLATVRTAENISTAEVRNIQNTLNAQLGMPVQLEIIALQVIKAPESELANETTP